jgi:hypothetical protein
MAKKENSAERWRIDINKDSRELFRKQWAEEKKKFPLDNKNEMEKGDGLRFYVEQSDNGKPYLCLEMPARYLLDLEAIANGERKPNLRIDPSEVAHLTKRALLGEFEPLISHFERGGKLTDQERQTLAKIARGKLPRIGRPPETKTEIRNRNIVRFVKILRAYGGKRVADVAAKKFEIDRSYIPKLEKKYSNAAVMDYLLGSLLTLFGADTETAWKARLVSAGINEDDIREATGRKQKVRK